MIQLVALGGGNEIGASCYLLKIQNISILLDVGLRPRPYQNTPLFIKMFDVIETWQDIKAIIISHSHLDHCGSLPKAFQNNPNIKIYVAPGNIDFISIQIKSVLTKRTDGRRLRFIEDYNIIEYAENLVEKCLNAIIEVPFFLRKKIPNTNIYFEFWPAGHILGSASIYIVTREGPILYTGDICNIPKISTQKLEYPKLPVKYLISESTYLQKENLLAPKEEFKELYDKTKKIVSKGGNVLIPCFALGKAQEIAALFVQRNSKESNPIPIYLDGLVKVITEIYQKQRPDFRVIENNKCKLIDRLAPDPDSFKKFIEKHIGCVIISSSGMLHEGSKSAFWAETLAPYKNNAIYFTGYIDEESPGYKLLNAIDNKNIKINGKYLNISCEIGKYYLSTHSHAAELLMLFNYLNPEIIYFVHGNVPPQKLYEFQMELESISHRTYKFQKVENYIPYIMGEINE